MNHAVSVLFSIPLLSQLGEHSRDTEDEGKWNIAAVAT